MDADSRAARTFDAVLLPEVKQALGQTSRYVQENRVFDELIRLAETSGNNSQQLFGERGVRVHRFEKSIARNFQRLGWLDGENSRRPRIAVDQRQLAEAIPRSQDTDQHFFAIF